MWNKIFLYTFAGVVTLVLSYVGASYFFSLLYNSNSEVVVETLEVSTTTTTITNTSSGVSEESILTTSTEYVGSVSTSTNIVLPTSILHDVPFTPQAPFGDWSDPRQQDGCEEASVVMAYRWAVGKGLTRQEALDEITGMSNWEEAEYGSYRDTSAADTLERLLRQFYEYTGGRVEYDISLADVKRELAAGHILIIPFDGHILDNPNFINGGPERHMLVAIGYDDRTEQIITNDPGTRLGQGFAYSYENFEAAFQDYETGNHVSQTEYRTAMIVVEKM